MARRARGKAAKRRRWSERIWTSTSADASESVLPVADSARFCRRVRMEATDHAQASWGPLVWKKNGSGSLANGCASMPAVHVPEQSSQGGFLLVRAEVFGRPCFGIACA
jgi:hypothetical protein